MKKTLLIAMLVTGAASVFGQGSMGQIQWGNNVSGFRAPIYAPDPGNPGVSQVGQSSLGTPTGSVAYAGALLGSGGSSNFTFAFFCGPGGASSNALVLAGSTSFRTAAGNALPAGLVFGATATVPGTVGGQSGTFQIRVWNNQGGTITTWAAAEQAWLSGLTAAGVSPLVPVASFGGIDTNGNAVNPPTDSGWTSFSLTQTVPEPGTMALAGLGAAALMIFRRRK